MMLESFDPENGPNVELIMCVFSQLASDIANENRVYILQGLSKIPDDLLLELLPTDHPVFEGRRIPSPNNPLAYPEYDLDEELHNLVVVQEPWHFN